MKVKNIILGLSSFCCFVMNGSAQNKADEVIFQAMQDELARNYSSLSINDLPKPYFLEYSLNIASNFEINAILGAVANSYKQPQNSTGSIRLMIGNKKMTNEVSYDGRGVPMPFSSEISYNELRRNLWLGTDLAYKYALQQFASKQSFLNANAAYSSTKSDDFIEIPTTSHISNNELTNVDMDKWEKIIANLSQVFNAYPQLLESNVILSGVNSVIYKTTSEGLKLKVPQSKLVLGAYATILAEDGVKINDMWNIVVKQEDELPSVDEMKRQIKEFAENMVALSKLTPVDEYYSGPVLFEDEACAQILRYNLVQPGSVIAWRSPEGKRAPGTLENRLKRKVVDKRLSVINHTDLNTYNGKNLYGSYEVDAEGVKPEKQLTLVEAGVLKQQLNGRIPTQKINYSTGSSRFSISPNRFSFLNAPGVTHIKAVETTKPERMRKELIKAAAAKKMEYVYVIKKIARQASQIYRIDVKSGKEEQVRAGALSEVDLSQLERLLAISQKENVDNYLYEDMVLSSLIYPSSIIVENVEINLPTLQKETPSVLKSPLQRLLDNQ
ncbi:MAG: metallopeptidase TldD-related protein [Marinifilaceae bacterium]